MLRELKEINALGVQEWFASARVGEKQSPMGVLSGRVMRKAFVESWCVLVSCSWTLSRYEEVIRG